MSIQRCDRGALSAGKRLKTTKHLAFVCTFLCLLVGCAQGEPPPGTVLPGQLPATLPAATATPASLTEAHWSVQALTPDYPLHKIEVAGTYEQIGYALGKWYQNRGFSARPLTDDEQELTRELIEFYEGVHPSILAQLRGMYAAYGLNLDEMKEGIPVSDNNGIRILLPGLVESSSCSIAFTRPEMAADGHARLGRNYDWTGEDPDTYLVFSRPQGSYATVVMAAHTPGLTAADGLNSQGLALGFASVRNPGYELPTGPALAASVAYRLILETCANVEEAIALLRSVPITFINPSPDEVITHLLLADRSGASAVVEFLPEGIVVSRSDAPYQVMTNSLWAGPADQPDCPRYRTAVEGLEAAQNEIDTEGLMAVMSSMHSLTSWTTIYDLEDLSLVLALPSVDPTTYYEFSLADFEGVGSPSLPFACTSFAVYAGETLYGMNFDYPDVECRFTIRPSGDMNVFQMEFLQGNDYSATVGMNSAGLFSSCQMLFPEVPETRSPGPDEVYPWQVYRQALFDAERVEEVAEFISDRRVVHWSVTLHDLFADVHGNAMVVEAGDGENVVTRIEDDFIVMTNFPNGDFAGQGYERVEGVGAERYKAAYENISAHMGTFDVARAFETLEKAVSSGDYPTQVSMVFAPETGTVYVALKQDFGRIWKVSIADETIETYSGFDTTMEAELGSSGVLASDLERASHGIRWGYLILAGLAIVLAGGFCVVLITRRSSR